MSEQRIGLLTPRGVMGAGAALALAVTLTACNDATEAAPSGGAQQTLEATDGPSSTPTQTSEQEGGGLVLVDTTDHSRADFEKKGKPTAKAELPDNATVKDMGILLMPRYADLCKSFGNAAVFGAAANALQAFDGSITPDITAQTGECRGYSSVLPDLESEEPNITIAAEVTPHPEGAFTPDIPKLNLSLVNGMSGWTFEGVDLPFGQVKCELPSDISQKLGPDYDWYINSHVENVDPNSMPSSSDIYPTVEQTLSDVAEQTCNLLGGTATEINIGAKQ